MVDTFHWVIFALHASTAIMITGGVWLRCSPDVWFARLGVDTYEVITNSTGFYLKDWSDEDFARCSLSNASSDKRCFNAGLPLYEKFPSNLGWHLFVLLGHFEWISTAFAFFYIRQRFEKQSWWICCCIVFVGTLLYLPFRGSVFVNEVFLLILNFIISCSVFYGYRGIYQPQQVQPSSDVVNASRLPDAPAQPNEQQSTWGEGNLIPRKLLDVQLVALRFCEYCITASELWVAVLSVYVSSPPAIMSIGGYTLILLTNLYGLLLHYSLVSDNNQVTLRVDRGSTYWAPNQLRMQPRRYLRVPESMLGVPVGFDMNIRKLFRVEQWDSYIASNMSTLLNSWLAYAVAMLLIFYQQTFLTSTEPPAFVVAAGWSLILSYTSFGVWMTLVYWFPSALPRICGCMRMKNTYDIAVLGLDVLSLSAKLSIVISLSWGFVFRAEGRCII